MLINITIWTSLEVLDRDDNQLTSPIYLWKIRDILTTDPKIWRKFSKAL
jgi:hypothetical protein